MTVDQAAVDQAAAELAIVEAVSALVGACPIVLAGSRATGEATADSDYDVYVVMPTLAAVRRLRDLRAVGDALAARLGVPVTVNPLPAFRLQNPGRTLIVWKLRREGKVLAPPSFRLESATRPSGGNRAISSYALSGLRYLVEDLDPRVVSEPVLAPGVAARVRKALRHAAQIELLRDGCYEPVLVDALAALPSAGAARLGSLADDSELSSTWFTVRDALVEHIDSEPDSFGRRLVVNTQFAALGALRTHKFRVRGLASAQSASERLARALVELTRAVERDGTLNPAHLRAANAALPEPCPSGAVSWSGVRDRIDEAWGDANPLVGF